MAAKTTKATNTKKSTKPTKATTTPKKTTAPKTTVNYDDKRLTEVKANEKEALTEIENTYGGMAEEAQKYGVSYE